MLIPSDAMFDRRVVAPLHRRRRGLFEEVNGGETPFALAFSSV
jgi:hypothetical protein